MWMQLKFILKRIHKKISLNVIFVTVFSIWILLQIKSATEITIASVY